MPLTDDEFRELISLRVLFEDRDVQRAARTDERFFQLALRRATLEQQQRMPPEDFRELFQAEEPETLGRARAPARAEVAERPARPPTDFALPEARDPQPGGLTVMDLLRVLMRRRPEEAPRPEVPTTNFAIPLEESLRLGRER